MVDLQFLTTDVIALTFPAYPSPAPSARAQLREGTADLHADLDARLTMILGQNAEGYRRFLVCSAMAVLPAECSLEKTNVAALLPDWSQRCRSDALRRDLADLSVPELINLPAPEVLGPAFQFGMLYALEGSRLGSRMMARQVKSTLDPVPEAATRYLSHGQNLPLWPTFLQRLQSSRHVHREPERALAGARAVFQLFRTAVAITSGTEA